MMMKVKRKMIIDLIMTFKIQVRRKRTKKMTTMITIVTTMEMTKTSISRPTMILS